MLSGSRSEEPTAPAGIHQTRVVHELWSSRVSGTVAGPLGSANRSRTSVTYPFASDAALRDSYVNPFGFMRLGRVLEDLDALAGTIAYKHCDAPATTDSPLHIVTASVDRITLSHRANLRDDMVLSGSVSWTGNSSMEIAMRATSCWAKEPWLEANFTFVALREGKAARIAPLKPETDDERAAFEAGAARAEAKRALRKQQKEVASDFSGAAGSAVDVAELLRVGRVMSHLPSLPNDGTVMMSSTSLSNCLLAQPQQRNTAGRIFGGFLMRRAFELAFSTAYVFAGAAPRLCLEVDEVVFRKAVEVGAFLKFESCVLYAVPAESAEVHVEVEAHVVDVGGRRTTLANIFAFTFIFDDGVELRKVLPASEEEATRIQKRVAANEAQVSTQALQSMLQAVVRL